GGDDSTSKFADALVASAAAAKHGAPVVLTGLGANKDNVDKSVKYIKDKMGDNTKVTIVGGTASVSDAIEKDIKGEKESTGKAEVQSIEALNLNQIKVVFASKVDEDSAEDVTNYEVDGDTLKKAEDAKNDEEAAKAILQDDGRTVVLTLAKAQEQHDEVTVKVKKGVLSEDKTKNVKEYEKDIVFKDLVAPKVSKVTVRGNNKVVVEFSEAILVAGIENEDIDKEFEDDSEVSKSNKNAVRAAMRLAREFEINGQSVDSMGLNDRYSVVKDSLVLDDKAYVNKVEFYFDSALDSGKNELKVLDGKKDDEILCDAAGFIVKEATMEFKVDEVTSKPKVKSVKGGTDGKIYIDFDRPMDTETAQDPENYELNSYDIKDIENVKVELKKGDTQVKISNVSDEIKTGSNVIEIKDKVKDAYGNKVDEDTRVSFKAEKDDTKPKVAAVTSIDAETIRIRFSEDVKYKHATTQDNYELKDADGVDVTDEYIKEEYNKDTDEGIKAANGTKDDTDVYDIKLSKKLTGGKYTLKIKNIADTSDNVMDDYTTTFNGEDDEAPEVNGIKYIGKKIIVQFSEEMDKASLRKAENYRYLDVDKKVKELPSKATINVASDNKTVTIEFPDAYKQDDTKPEDKQKIRGFIVKSDVKDLAGNKMEADHRDDDMDGNGISIGVKKNSFKAEKKSDDVEVTLKFDAAIDKLVSDGGNFLFYKDGDVGNTVKANSVKISGDILIFKFNDGERADAIKSFGADLMVKTDEVAAKDKAGQDVKLNQPIKVYDNLMVPELNIEEKNGNVVNWKATNDSITIKFDVQIDKSLSSAYKDDFDFIADSGKKLEVKNVEIDEDKDNEIKFIFENADALKEGVDKVTVKANKDKVDVRTKKDEAGNYKEYKPEDKDISGRKVKVSDAKTNAEKEQAAKDLEEAKKTLNQAITEAKAKIDTDEKKANYKANSVTAYEKAIKTAEEALKEGKTSKDYTDAKAALEKVKLEEKAEREEPKLTINTKDGKTFTGLTVDGATVTVKDATVENGKVIFNEEQNELEVTVTYAADDDNKAATFEITYTVTKAEEDQTWNVELKQD
ncbi:cell wall-binding repeat-containing protein, partial [Coprococcus sp. MSK.21.13]|nr:cell wall-binding repeat-containing protein [Coprococcus sp. MSK.21.13]